MYNKSWLLIFMFILSGVSAQKNKQTDEEFLDSVKACFIDHDRATELDDKWLKEVYTEDLFDELQQTIAEVDLEKPVDYQLSTELLKKRLKDLNAKTPFEIEYHPSLENTIKYYLKNRTFSYKRLLAVSEYYFPMFEAKLAQYNLPLEIKYLAIVESALNPKAISRVGASGLWQFMYRTGLEYDLRVDSYVDERYDPLKATEAMCQYMTNMYRVFGDWNLVLASYNAGPGNVTKAIRRSHNQKNYWNIRRNLPRETQGYVPAFLATLYIFEYHKEHGIVANEATHQFIQTDTIRVRERISFEQVSELLDIPYAELQFLNPAYKMNVVPYVEGQKNSIRLPLDKVGVFASNEDCIYEYSRYMFGKREKARGTGKDGVRKSSDVIYHVVRKKETISGISRRYGVTVKQIYAWNNLSNSNIDIGQRLKIHSKDASHLYQKYHVVKKGETLSVIAMKYKGVTVSRLKAWNNLRSSRLKIGQRLRLSR